MKVIKKLGYRQDFDINKIQIALKKTAKAAQVKFNASNWKELKPRIESRLKPVMKDREEIYFWEIDEAVIDTLLRTRFNEITKEYIKTRSTIIKDRINDLGLSPHALNIVKERYLRKDDSGEPIETVRELMCRVASAVASAEPNGLREKYTDLFSKMLLKRDFLPNSPALVAAGTKHKGTYAACFAYDIEDSIDDITSVERKTVKTFQLGGGVGISIAKLREKGSKIHTTNGTSSGSVKFLDAFNTWCEVIQTGGFRRGALMAINRYNHPDIEWFIHCKRDVKKLNNMNISVLVEDKFFDALKNNKNIPLISPKTDTKVDEISSNLLLEHIATNIWETGEPGILFYDAMNKANPTPHLGDIRLTNPCSESNLLNNEACVLGSINLVNHMTDDKTDMDWDELANTTKLATRFLDDMIDASAYPVPEVEEMVKSTRKIGIGIMGFADVLIKMGLKYSSKDAITMAGKVMSFINDVADQESKALGEEKGLYKEYKKGYRKRRNAITTVLAPTGTLSLIAGVSPGVEPNFYKEYSRIINNKIVTIRHPLRDSPVFESCTQVAPEQHLKILAEFQKYTENSVSKTINVPENTTVEDIKNIILKAHSLGVKGITILRENSSREPLIKCEDCKI
jgi:ribonucleoside-diphosphate reductase alpha chain